MGEPGSERRRPLAAAAGAGGPGAAVPGPRAGGPTRPSGRWSPPGSAGSATRPVPGPLGGAPVAGHLRRGRPVGPGAGRRAAGRGGRAGRRRPVPAPQLGGGRHHLLGRRLPGRGGRAHRPLLRAPRRSTTSCGPSSPGVVVTADRFGHNDYLATYDGLLSGRPGTRWLVVGEAPDRRPAARARALRRRCSTPIRSPAPCPSIRTRRPSSASPRAPPATPRASIHSHRTIGCETRQLDYMFPDGRTAPDHRGAGRPLHRDAQRLPGAAAPGRGRST